MYWNKNSKLLFDFESQDIINSEMEICSKGYVNFEAQSLKFEVKSKTINENQQKNNIGSIDYTNGSNIFY
jgi:hypothetical protein